MSQTRNKPPALAAFLFIGIAFVAIGISNNTSFVAIGCAFIAIGAAAIARHRMAGRKQKPPDETRDP